MLASHNNGKILCDNTLDAQLDVVFREKLRKVNFFMHVNSCSDFVSFVRYFLLNCLFM